MTNDSGTSDSSSTCQPSRNLSLVTATEPTAKMLQRQSPLDIAQSDFQHEPLNLKQASIRLVEVLPADASGIVQCRIRRATIEASYTCVSYVWGPPEDTQPISLNGKALLVRRNIWMFLKTVSSQIASKQRVDNDGTVLDFREAAASLWIDALCIDQDNNGEKNHQVQQMGEIFSRARRVIAWAGTRHTSLLRYMREKMENESFFNPNYYLALQDFCDDVYWRRAWVRKLLPNDVCFLIDLVR